MNYPITLSDERKEELEKLAALGYEPKEMALYFGIDQETFIAAVADTDSNVYFHIQRGKLISQAKEQMALLADAESGNVTASEHLGKIRRNRGWQISKIDIFGGFEDKKLLANLEDYIQSGAINKLSAEEAIYIEALTLFSSMSRRYGRRNTIRFFTNDPFGLSYSRASEMYDEAINLFYTDRNVEKKALRHLKAEMLEEAAMVVRDNAVTSKDWEVFGNLQMQAAKLQELDKPDMPKLPAELYMKQLRIYSLDTEMIGLPKIDRQELASQIEHLEIPQRDKTRLKGDALLAPFNITETLNDLQEESQSED